MKIVAFDTDITDFDGLSWDAVASLGEFVPYRRSSRDELIERGSGADAVITNKVVLDSEIIHALPDLKYIGISATGVNNVEVDAARKRGIAVTNVTSYSAPSVAQMVFAYLLDHAMRIRAIDAAVKQGDWVKSEDFCFFPEPMVELAGRTLGIVGYGDIGQKIATIAKAFDMNVVIAAVPGRAYDTPRVPLEEVFAVSDYVSLHCPLTEATSEFVNEELLAKMKPEAVLVNTGRGGLVKESALADTLNNDKIAHAYLDVLSSEPPPANNPLLSARNVTLTPHIAWGTRECRARLIEEVAKNIEAFQKGELRNRVD